MKSTSQDLHQDGSRLRRFCRVYGRLFREAAWPHRGRVTLIVLGSLLTAAIQGSMIAMLAVLVAAIEHGPRTGISFIDERFGPNMESIVVVAGAFFVLQTVAALVSYLAATQSRRIARAYNARASRRVLDLFGGAEFDGEEPRKYAMADVQQLMVRNSRVAGSALEQLIAMAQPILYTVVVVGTLAYLNWAVTLLLVPAFLLMAPVLSRFGSHVQREAQLFFDQAGQELALAVRRCLLYLDTTNVFGARIRDQVGASYDRDPAVMSCLDNYDHILLSNDRSVLITSIFRPTLILIVLLVLGGAAVSGAMSWGFVIIYLIALAQLGSRFQQLLATLTSLIRFHPLIRGYQQFCDLATRAANTPSESDTPRLSLRAGDDVEPLSSLDLGAGDLVQVITDQPLDRCGFAPLIAPLIDATASGATQLRTAAFRSARFLPPAGTVAATLFGTDDVTPEELDRARKLFRDLDLADEIDDLESGWQTVLDLEARQPELAPNLRAALQVLPAALEGRPIVLLDWRLVAGRDEVFVQRLLEAFSDQLLLLVTNPQNRDEPLADVFVVLREGRIAGIGDREWYRSAGRAQARAAQREAPIVEVMDDVLLDA